MITWSSSSLPVLYIVGVIQRRVLRCVTSRDSIPESAVDLAVDVGLSAAMSAGITPPLAADISVVMSLYVL